MTDLFEPLTDSFISDIVAAGRRRRSSPPLVPPAPDGASLLQDTRHLLLELQTYIGVPPTACRDISDAVCSPAAFMIISTGNCDWFYDLKTQKKGKIPARGGGTMNTGWSRRPLHRDNRKRTLCSATIEAKCVLQTESWPRAATMDNEPAAARLGGDEMSRLTPTCRSAAAQMSTRTRTASNKKSLWIFEAENQIEAESPGGSASPMLGTGVKRDSDPRHGSALETSFMTSSGGVGDLT